MRKILFLIFAVGVAMTAVASTSLPEFDKLWNFDNPTETEVKFREILPLAELPQDLDYRLQLLTQIARTQGLQRKFAEAHSTLNDVERSLTQDTWLAAIRYNLERGRVFNSSQEKAKALPFFLAAFELSNQKHKDDFAVDAAHMLAIAESTSEKQMEWNLKALAIAEGSSDVRVQGWLGSLYNNIGWTYHDSGRFTEALELFRKALAFRETRKDPSTIRIAKWCIARTYRSLNQLEQSLEIQKALEAEFDQLQEKDGYVFEELGELYLIKGMAVEAQKYFGLAYYELSKDEGFKTNEAQRLARIKELGRVE